MFIIIIIIIRATPSARRPVFLCKLYGADSRYSCSSTGNNVIIAHQISLFTSIKRTEAASVMIAAL